MIHRPRPSLASSLNSGRRASLAYLAGTALSAAGCGGGGGGSAEGTSPSPSPAPAPAPNRSRSPNAAPVAGAFGGGQGRIVYVTGVIDDDTLYEMDLATRVVTKLVELPGVRLEIEGGVTRASNGRLAVLVDTGNLDTPVEVRIYEPNGNLAFTHDGFFWGIHAKDGAAISPDGRHVAIVGIAPYNNNWNIDALTVVVNEVEAGNRKLIIVEQADDLGSPSPTLAWTPDNRLLLLTINSLYEIDIASGSATRRHTVDLAGASSAMVSADGREIWFVQGRGNQYGGTIWSLDLTSGQVRQRSTRSSGWGQHAPAISPDGQWMLASEGVSGTDGATIFLSFYITATRLTEPPTDVANFANEILDTAGKKIEGNQRMAWY